MTGKTVIMDVLSGKDARLFASSVNLDYKDIKNKDKLLSADDNSFLLITKEIGSNTTILDVKDIDDTLIKSMLV